MGGGDEYVFLSKRNCIDMGAFIKNNMACMIILGQREIEKGGMLKYK